MTKIKESPSTAVKRAMTILDTIAARPGGMTNADLSRKLQIPKSSASYILRALENSGYLRRAPSGKYKLGLKLLSLRHSALAELDIRELALPTLQQLVDHTGKTGHVAILDREEAVYIERVEAPGFVKMDTWIGRRMDLHSTAVGKALLAFQNADFVQQVITSRGLPPHTPKTITGQAKLLKELEKVREAGYAIDDEENSMGVRCAAAPIFGAEGNVDASIGVTGLIATKDDPQSMGEVVREAARRISLQLGYRPKLRGRVANL